MSEVKNVCGSVEDECNDLLFKYKWVGRFLEKGPIASDVDVRNFYNTVVYRQEITLKEIVADASASCVGRKSGEYAMLAACMDYVLRARMDSFLARLQGNQPSRAFCTVRNTENIDRMLDAKTWAYIEGYRKTALKIKAS